MAVAAPAVLRGRGAVFIWTSSRRQLSVVVTTGRWFTLVDMRNTTLPRLVALAGCCWFLAVPTPASADSSDVLHINEILHNPEGTDSPYEYVEMKGAPNAVIPAGTYLVFIEGDAATAGDVQNVFDLSGLTLGSNGFLVLLQGGSNVWNSQVNAAATKIVGSGTGWTGVAGWQADSAATDIENEAYTAFLITSATAPSLTLDIDANNDGTAEALPAAWTILDGVSADANTTLGAPELLYATAKFLDAEWVGRPTGDPSGMAQADWVGSAFANGTVQLNPALNETTEPTSYSGKVLNHIGSANFPLDPPAEVPEAPVTVMLAVTGAAVLGAGVMLGNRRRTA
jgi:hypothetical protein